MVASIRSDADAIVEHLARDVRRISDILDFVIVPGDLTDDAKVASFRRFEELFFAVGVPVYVVPGNHDGPAGYYAYCGQSDVFAGWNIVNRVIELPNLRLLGIDTCIEGMTTGRISADTLGLVESEIQRQDAPPLIIVMHHPPIAPGLADFDAVAQLESSDGFLEIIRRADRPQIILSGHVHRPYQARRKGAACFVAGSPTSTFTSDLPFGPSPIRFHGLQDHYYVHEVDTSGRHVVTPQNFSYPDPMSPKTGLPLE